jgi:N-methylhydantoinase A
MPKIRIACDVGGTFTDLVVATSHGLRLFKASTTPVDPLQGIFAAITMAADGLGNDVATMLGETEVFIHATTRATNAMLTGNTAKTGFLTTAGHRDILLLREGGRLNPYDNSQPFPRPYVPRALTFEVTERISSSGEILRPLDEVALALSIERLMAEHIEAVGVCLLWSVANPIHELRVGEIIGDRLPAVPVTLSHQLNPILREYRRASSTCIDASLKPVMGRYLKSLDGRLRDGGFDGKLMVVTSQGGFIDATTAGDAPIHTLRSGPSIAPIAARHVARTDAPQRDVIVADTGGTSYDVGLVRDDRIPWSSETWLGPRFNGHMTGFSSVDVRSIGAGGGSIAWLDQGGLLHVGPQSAGATPGPVCYGRGGVLPTVTDCALALGFLDPDTFLGGRLPLDVAAARRSIETSLARPLNLTVEMAALSVIDLLSQAMITAIEDITVQQGVDPARTVLVAGGGAAGINSVNIGCRLGCQAILFPHAGAALSAVGALLSELIFVDARVQYVRSDAPDFEAIDKTLNALTARLSSFAATAAGGTVCFDYWVEARYPQQTWEIEIPLAGPRMATPDDLAEIVQDFHDAHRRLYAVADPASPIEILVWRARACCPMGKLSDARVKTNSAPLRANTRRIYLADQGWTAVPLWEFDAIEGDLPLQGPVIIESAFTTIVIPEGTRAVRLDSGSIKVTPLQRAML